MKIVYRQKPNDAQTLYGLSINGDTLELTYPVFLTFSNDLVAKRKELYAYMASIEIGKKIEERINGSFRAGYPLAVEAARYIIDDYLKNGFYINRENAVQKNASGRINWKKTFQKNSIIVRKKNVFFHSIYANSSICRDNDLVRIHHYCVKKSIDLIGWIWNLSSVGIECDPFSESRTAEYLLILQRELEATFLDWKRLLIINMIHLIKGLDDNREDTPFEFKTSNYDYVFERMVNDYFGGIDFSCDPKMNPKGEWHIFQNGQVNVFGTTPLRIDTLVEDDKAFYIIDSKFYPFSSVSIEKQSNGLPDTYSIVKQVFYAMYFSKLANGKDVKNIFILPYDCNSSPFGSSPFAYAGYALFDLPTVSESQKKIHTFLVDFKHLLLNWKNCAGMPKLMDYCDNRNIKI